MRLGGAAAGSDKANPWPGLATAAAVLAVWAGLGLGAGTAQADDGPADTGPAVSAEPATRSDAAEPDDAGPATDQGPTSAGRATPERRPADAAGDRGAGPDPDVPDPDEIVREGLDLDTTGSGPDPDTAAAGPDPGVADGEPDPVPVPGDDLPAGADGPVTSREPRPAPGPAAARRAATPAPMIGTGQIGTGQIGLGAARSVPQPDRPAHAEARAGLRTAAVTPAAAADEPPLPPTDLGLQLTGGIADVGTIVVSAVHGVAAAVAHAFGPDTLFGVPYLLAMSVANAAAAVGRIIVGAPAFDIPAAPFSVNFGILDVAALFAPARPPAGANDPDITVTPEHPLPVILLNSTVLTQGIDWSVGAPVLANAGYKVYTFNYGNVTDDPNFPLQSIGDIRLSAQELAAEVDRVLAETGAEKVILIGHSQGGGILPVYYINHLGGAEKVSQVIGIVPGNHGTDFNGLIPVLLSVPVLREVLIGLTTALAPAIYQQAWSAPFLDEAYAGGDTRPGVRYTNILTVHDEVATPYHVHALHGENVRNIVLQQRFPGLVLGHLNAVVSPQVWAIVLEELAANPEANPLGHPAAAAA
ncbi:alpha/beta fold hydrolase [uncultured Mycolicibacterium sp.]|uniref:alpha/beta fold hydrolase n=1 Tax=uncultured Mycolicibacterium sp. TaxID=2320817 RepID=UPI0026032784|nr:alpha/beta fold hydrolase [uncultured Mycolicibacterium sp.]